MTIRVFTSFQAVPAHIRRQLSYPHEPNFFLSLDWYEPLFETCLVTTHNPRIYVVLGAEEEVLCSLYCAASVAWPRALLSLTNFYSVQYLPGLVGKGRNNAALSALTSHIGQERPRWDLLRLSTLTDGDEATGLFDGLRSHGFLARRYFQYENWHARVAGESFESYFAQRPSQLRNTVARKQKKLEKLHKVELRFSTEESSDLERLIRDFTTVYEASWKKPEPFPGFIPALATRCASLGILRMGVLYVDGAAAAAQLWITSGTRAFIYKLAYDEKFGQLGVGSILSRELFRRALDEDRVDEIDYGVGSEPYKKDWMTSVRQIRGIEAYNLKTASGLLRGTWAEAKAAAKKWRPARKPAEVVA